MLYNAISHATENFNNNNVLGRGNASVVYAGFFDGSRKAFKVFNNVESFRHEKNILTILNNHINIINLINYDNENHIIIIECMDGGTLFNYIDTNIIINAQEIIKRLNLALDISKGLEYIHDNDILHKDINASNVLLNNNHTSAKICNF